MLHGCCYDQQPLVEASRLKLSSWLLGSKAVVQDGICLHLQLVREVAGGSNPAPLNIAQKAHDLTDFWVQECLASRISSLASDSEQRWVVEDGFYGSFCKFEVLVVSVLPIRALLFGVCVGAPDFWEFQQKFWPFKPRPSLIGTCGDHLGGSRGLFATIRAR